MVFFYKLKFNNMHTILADSAQHRTGVPAPSTGSKGPGSADQDPLQISGDHSRPLPTEGEGKHCFSLAAEAALLLHCGAGGQRKQFTVRDQ